MCAGTYVDNCPQCGRVEIVFDVCQRAVISNSGPTDCPDIPINLEGSVPFEEYKGSLCWNCDTAIVKKIVKLRNIRDINTMGLAANAGSVAIGLLSGHEYIAAANCVATGALAVGIYLLRRKEEELKRKWETSG